MKNHFLHPLSCVLCTIPPKFNISFRSVKKIDLTAGTSLLSTKYLILSSIEITIGYFSYEHVTSILIFYHLVRENNGLSKMNIS